MRIDPESGALDAEAWRLDRREPLSSFAQWAPAAGFSPDGTIDVDGWSVYAVFTLGGLRRVRLSRDHDRPYKKQVEVLGRWLDQQRRPRWLEAGVHWDKFFSDAHVSIVYPEVVTDGPEPRPDDLAVLAAASAFVLRPAEDWSLPPAFPAFERLARRRPSVDEVAEVVRTGTAAGRVYATWLLPEAERAEAFEVLRGDTTPLRVDSGMTTVGAYAGKWTWSASV